MKERKDEEQTTNCHIVSWVTDLSFKMECGYPIVMPCVYNNLNIFYESWVDLWYLRCQIGKPY